MSYSAQRRVNLGAYERPFSGVGIEFYPLNTVPEASGFTLHECGYLPKNKDWNFPSVFSPFWRLYYNIERGHCVVFGQDMTELTPDRIMLIPDHHMFHCLGQHPVPTFWLAFSVARRIQAGQKVPIMLKPAESELCLIKDLCRMVEKDKDFAPGEEIYQYSAALLNIILCRKDIKWQEPLPENLARAVKYIRSNLSGRLTVPAIAKSAGLSVEGLFRSFRKNFHSTPVNYISELRISEASHRLIHTSLGIDDIAAATGFPNRAYFSRVFHKITGEWPAAFRKKHQKKV